MYYTPLGCVVESFLAHSFPDGTYGDVREACALFAKAAATVELDAECAWRANPPHADHFLSLDRHDLTRMASPYQNYYMGSKAEAWRPGEDTCSQYRSWAWTGHNTSVTISGEGPFDFAKLGIPILRSDDPSVVEALARGTFRRDYLLAEYPLIQDQVTGSLVSRHGQVYVRKTQLGCGRTVPDKWSLRTLHLGRHLYPRFSNRERKVRCHNVMARLTIGKRPDGHVTDHVGQDNKEDFSEENLEYVTRSENASRHVSWKRGQAARLSGLSGLLGSSTASSGSSTTWIDSMKASAKERKDEENRKRKSAVITDTRQTSITKFFKRV